MLFNSLSFLLFFPLVTLLYFALPHRGRWIWLLVCSYFFYMCWNASYAILIATSTLITYLSGVLIGKANENPDPQKAAKLKKLWVALSFCSNLAILVFFKYFYFAVDNINAVLSALHLQLVNPSFDIVLPVGISFYTFQALSYTMDVYRNDIRPEKNFGKYALFVSFFPQLVAGPIERSGNLLNQIHEEHTFNYQRMVQGLLVMAWGYFLKMVMADRVAILVNTVYNDWQAYSSGALVVASVLFAVQVYCDFSGYSYIAIGAARIMGFSLMDNFHQPYYSTSIKEFWRNWHISLSTWFKDYLYIPLGGNRKGKARTYLNLLITFLVSGLWHGANWTFVIWGGLHGLYQVIGGLTLPLRRKATKALGVRTETLSYRLMQGLITFVLVDFAWIFFRANSVSDSFGIIQRIFTQPDFSFLFGDGLMKLGLAGPELKVALLSVVVLLVGDYLQRKMCVSKAIMRQALVFRWVIYLAIIAVIAVFGIYGPNFDASQFIYFQF